MATLSDLRPTTDAPAKTTVRRHGVTPVEAYAGLWLDNSKDASSSSSKRKRVNRIAKLKQWKLEARREQWLSQKSGTESTATSSSSSKEDGSILSTSDAQAICANSQVTHANSQVACPDTLKGTPQVVSLVHADSTPPASHPQKCFAQPEHRLLLSERKTSMNFLADTRQQRIQKPPNTIDNSRLGVLPSACPDISTRSSENSRMAHCGAAKSDKRPERNVSMMGKEAHSPSWRGGRRTYLSNENTDGKENGCLPPETDQNCDDKESWEAVANAEGWHVLFDTAPGYAVSEDIYSSHDPKVSRDVGSKESIDRGSHNNPQATVGRTVHTYRNRHNTAQRASTRVQQSASSGSLNPAHGKKGNLSSSVLRSANGTAWRADDICQPASLPRLSKQQNRSACPSQPQQHFSANEASAHAPTQICPICVEDFDDTDSSFHPCPCGFMLCVFCYHKIVVEGDSRCPGCRRVYSKEN